MKKKDSSPNARKARWGQLMSQHTGSVNVELGKCFDNDDFMEVEHCLRKRLSLWPNGSRVIPNAWRMAVCCLRLAVAH